jgi:hypothetical protein
MACGDSSAKVAQLFKISRLISTKLTGSWAKLARCRRFAMDEVITKEVLELATDPRALQLGQWMGRREAFGLMAGRCSAADIEILRRVREEKQYALMNCSWGEFCSRHLHVARRTVDREIGHLSEFGPAFFSIRQLTHIGVKEYRTIAPQITEQGVNMDGNLVALLPENSELLNAAVERLLQGSGSRDPDAVVTKFDAVLKRCKAAGRSLRALDEPLDAAQIRALVKELVEIRNAGEVLGARYIEVNLGLRA